MRGDITVFCIRIKQRLKSLFHSSQKPTRKLAASAFKHCDWMEVSAASLRVGFGDEWKRAIKFSAGKCPAAPAALLPGNFS